MPEIYDIAVIGGGPAGYTAAIHGAQLGGKVILFEKDTLGGTCLNRGCIPTKTLLKTAETLHAVRNGGQRGILGNTAALYVDMAQAVTHKNGIIRQLTGGVASLLRSHSIPVVKGDAHLVDRTHVRCGEKTYEASHVILCGGSMAAWPPIEGISLPCVLTSDEILDIMEIPHTLAVIGGGVIGCELATVFSSFGSKVTIVDAAPQILPTLDGALAQGVRSALEKYGVSILTGQNVKRIEQNGAAARIVLEGASIVADKILLSTGRVANLHCLGALRDCIKLEKGKIAVDACMRTSVPNIYAAGDITGRHMLAHAAFVMAEAAAEGCMGAPREIDLSRIPSCVYTIPEAASIGMTETEAKLAYGNRLRVGQFPFAANGRALASGEPEGFVKVLSEDEFGEIVGVQILGTNAAEMIAEACSLIHMEITVDEAARIVHAHPTYSEAFMEACADALGESIHLPRRKG